MRIGLRSWNEGNRGAMRLGTKTLAALLVAGLSWPATLLAAEPGVANFTLDNGLELVVIEDHRAPSVVHMVWYRAGAADEIPGVSGIAHFLEHLMFKGTDTLEPGEFSKIVAANGGTDNAFTSLDYTAYHQQVAADRLNLMMQMEADRMVNLELTEENVRTEREVILEERNQRVENDPGALSREQQSAALYMNHPYGVPVIGWKHEMAELDLEDAFDFYQQHYGPNNAVVVVAGDVIPDDVLALAEEYYGPVPPNPEIAVRDRPSEPPQLVERRLTYVDARLSQPYMVRTYLAPERDPGAQREAAALELFAELLGGGQTAYLAKKLQFETQTALYSSAFYRGQALDETSFGLVVVPAAGVSLEDAEAAMDAAIETYLSEGIDEAHLERIKFQLKAAQIYEMDNVGSRARRYGAGLTSGLTLEDIEAWPEILQSITPDEIVAAARDVLNRKSSVTSYLRVSDQEEVSQ